MKIRACTLSFLWSLLLIEPLSANFDIETIYSSCAERQGSSSNEQDVQSCCSKPSEQPEDKEGENGCEANRCNPLMSCPTGNFYLFSQPHVSIEGLLLSKEKQALINDNRIVNQMAECWHPPEII